MLRQGDRIPAFSALATGGTAVRSDELRGSPVVLYFYPMDRTPGCVMEGRDFKALYAEFRSRGAAIFGISMDSMSSHEKFKAKYEFPFELIVDSDGNLCRQFDVIREKSLFGRKFKSIERSTFLIDADGILRREWRKTRISGHAGKVLEALDEL